MIRFSFKNYQNHQNFQQLTELEKLGNGSLEFIFTQIARICLGALESFYSKFMTCLKFQHLFNMLTILLSNVIKTRLGVVQLTVLTDISILNKLSHTQTWSGHGEPSLNIYQSFAEK